MPDVTGAEYLVGHWQSVGRCSSNGMGMAPLMASEVLAWQQGTNTDLLPWEFTAILEMSRGYVSMIHEGEKLECPPPFGNPVQEFDREAVGRKIKNAFQAFLQARR